MRVAGYIRVSTAEQSEEGFSLASQEQAIRAYAAALGAEVGRLYTDAGRSAFSDEVDKRPAFAALLADVAAGRWDVVAVAKLDRFARSTLVAVQQLRHLYAHNCALVSLAEQWDFSTASGRFQFQLMSSLAEFDSRLKSERVKGAIATKRSRGGYHGGYPFGAIPDPEGGLMVDPLRADSLRHLLELAAEKGALTIAGALTAAGVPTRRGHAIWHPSGVHSFVKTGRWLLDQPEPWPTLYRAARDRPRLPNTNASQGVNLLSGLMRCGCGGVLVYSSKRQPSTGERYLECRNYSSDRPRGQGCPIRGKRTAPYYEAIVEAAFLSLGPFRELPEDARVAEARVRLAERRRIVEDLYIETRDKAVYDTRIAAIVAEEATLPVPLPLAAGFITELARGQELWRAGAVSVRHRNALLRSSFARVVITGRECAIEPVPLLERLIEATERARVVGVG